MSGAAPESSTLVEAARCLLSAAQERGLTIAVAESLTGGGVVSALVGVPGASAVVVGGVVAYATRIKAELLGHCLVEGPANFVHNFIALGVWAADFLT